MHKNLLPLVLPSFGDEKCPQHIKPSFIFPWIRLRKNWTITLFSPLQPLHKCLEKCHSLFINPFSLQLSFSSFCFPEEEEGGS